MLASKAARAMDDLPVPRSLVGLGELVRQGNEASRRGGAAVDVKRRVIVDVREFRSPLPCFLHAVRCLLAVCAQGREDRHGFAARAARLRGDPRHAGRGRLCHLAARVPGAQESAGAADVRRILAHWPTRAARGCRTCCNRSCPGGCTTSAPCFVGSISAPRCLSSSILSGHLACT